MLDFLPSKKNIQIYPSKTIYFPNDRFSKKITTFTKDNFKNMNEGEALKLVELKNHKKFGKIVSPFRIYVDENSSFTLSEPIDQFDFAILCACVSEYHIDNHYTTPAIIHRALTGKVNKGSEAEPSKDQLANIMNSIEKLMFLKSKINMTDYCQKLKCNDGNAFEILSPLLPCKIITETTINGKASIVIQFTDVSPFWQIASLLSKESPPLRFHFRQCYIPIFQPMPIKFCLSVLFEDFSRFFIVSFVYCDVSERNRAIL